MEVNPISYANVQPLFANRVEGGVTTLNATQCKWSAHKKEAYALILALHHWKVYLAGTMFTDNNLLVQLRATKDPRGKFTYWLTELEEFSFDIEYKPGKLNINPDILSEGRK